MNLLVNARDAIPEGGEITISAQKEAVGPGHFTKLPEGDFIKLVVADQGEGMDEATLARATEPFFTTKGVGKGTGLGLSMVHGLAEQSGGRFIVRSQRGEGTQVEIWLPVASDSEVKTAEAEQAPVPENQLETQVLDVLVVDDDTLVLATMVAQLEELGHHVTQSNSAEQALETLQSGQHFDVVISDHAAAGNDGFPVCAARPKPPSRNCQSSQASGYAELPGNLENRPARLKKPFTQRELGFGRGACGLKASRGRNAREAYIKSMQSNPLCTEAVLAKPPHCGDADARGVAPPSEDLSDCWGGKYRQTAHVVVITYQFASSGDTPSLAPPRRRLLQVLIAEVHCPMWNPRSHASHWSSRSAFPQ